MKLSDCHLIEAYYSAIELDLDNEFIRMLIEEINRRNLKLMTNHHPEW
ncbi:sporulation histidine kinase inhibitor Sda [Bacillus sp. SA1-12]|nr:sporulation histidine kinase inhibitor Sda [Bacillus sp. SA1-12]